ncbi:hypothetical protein ACP275_08G122700 [Erythranthe tilingii]
MEMEDESDMQLVLIPWPVMGHVQIIEFANLIIHRQNHLLPLGRALSVTVLVIKLPDYIDTVSSSFADSLSASSSTTTATANSNSGLNFFLLPPTDPIPAEWSSRTRGYFMYNLVQSQKSNVSDFLHSRRRRIAGVVVDMLCTTMMGVAEDLGLPSYVFFTSPASFLGAMLHCQTIHDQQSMDVAELRNADSDVHIPSFAKPVPPQVLSMVLVDKQIWLKRFLHHARDYRRAKGIIVNTFTELESHALDSFSLNLAYGDGGNIPPIYPIGPIMNHHRHSRSSPSSEVIIMEWLEKQPPSSVVLLCFGSQGSLHQDQVRQLALGLEQSEQRFIWSLRRQSPEGKGAKFPSEYAGHDALRGVLPEGFLERTSEKGKVVGWVPQLELLSHRSVGGFVSHCGWNSVLESLWCGVPIATWPLHSEQKMNAFQLARELGLAVVITLSYDERKSVVMAAEIERGIRELMESGRGSEVRRRVEEMSEKSRLSVMEGGSSYISLNRLIHNVMSNIHAPNQ